MEYYSHKIRLFTFTGERQFPSLHYTLFTCKSHLHVDSLNYSSPHTSCNEPQTDHQGQKLRQAWDGQKLYNSLSLNR